MSEDNLKIGSLTASFNNGKYLKEWFGGLLNQTRPLNEIVIVDDGSTDDSRDKLIQACEEFGGRLGTATKSVMMDNSHWWHPQYARFGNTKLTFFPQKENKGPAAARNVGLKYLLDKTDVICIADSDDVYYPKKVEKSVEVLLKYPQVALVYSDYDTFNEKSGELKREFKESYSYARLFQECIVSNNSAIATKVINEVGLYDESLFGPEDYDLWLRIGEKAAVYHIPESLYKYRLSGNNITLTTPSQKFAEHVRRVHQKAIDRRSNGN